MPQPLSRVHTSSEIYIGSGTLNRKPEFALSAMRVISAWSHIDGDLTTILSTMLSTDIRTGTAMYQALSGGEAKRAVLLAAAENALKPWKFILLQAVMEVTKALRKMRNSFAHDVWGYSTHSDDCLLLLPSDVAVEANISRKQVNKVEGTNVIRPTELDRERIMVYDKADFANAENGAGEAGLLHAYLYLMVYGAPELGRRWLLIQPRILQALPRLTKKSDPLTLQILTPPKDGAPPPEGTH